MIADARNFMGTSDFCCRNSYFFIPNDDVNEDVLLSYEKSRIIDKSFIDDIVAGLYSLCENNWKKDSITLKLHQVYAMVAKRLEQLDGTGLIKKQLKFNMSRIIRQEVQSFLRAAVANGQHGPGISISMEMLGKELCLRRLNNFQSAIGKNISNNEKIASS